MQSAIFDPRSMQALAPRASVQGDVSRGRPFRRSIVGAPLPNFHDRSAHPATWRPGDPSPDLLTAEEAIRYLRLHEIEIKNPRETLRRYRKEGRLRGTQVGKRVYYLRGELDEFLRKMTEINPR
jgi:hypothetical protein